MVHLPSPGGGAAAPVTCPTGTIKTVSGRRRQLGADWVTPISQLSYSGWVLYTSHTRGDGFSVTPDSSEASASPLVLIENAGGVEGLRLSE